MDGYVVIEVVISLCFVFLTYSLLTSILVEIADTLVNLRGRNLRRAIRRMLQDEHKKRWKNWWRSRKYEKPLVKQFFNQPNVKYLAKNWIYQTPSNIPSDTFSKTIIDLLTQREGVVDMAKIEQMIGYYDSFDQRNAITDSDWNSFETEFGNTDDKAGHIEDWLKRFEQAERSPQVEATNKEIAEMLRNVRSKETPDQQFEALKNWKTTLHPKWEIDTETQYQLCLIYRDSGRNLTTFKQLLEGWFDDMMNHARDWYKKWTARIAFFLGLIIAVTFNLDSMHMGKLILRNDGEVARALADDIRTHADTLGINNRSEPIANEVSEANTTSNEQLEEYNKVLEKYSLIPNSYQNFDDSPWLTILGWILTAIAVSFGAPFWFDLLNKFMRFRAAAGTSPTRKKEESREGSTSDKNAFRRHTEG